MSTSTHETILSATDRLEAQSVVSMLAAHGIGDTALPLKVSHDKPAEHLRLERTNPAW